MEYYVRYGVIPENERSVDFLKLSFEENEDFTWYLQDGIHKTRLEALSAAIGFDDLDRVLEAGTSVFRADENGNPITENEAQEKTLKYILKENRAAYLVTGDEVGKGHDAEPLLRNIQIIREL